MSSRLQFQGQEQEMLSEESISLMIGLYRPVSRSIGKQRNYCQKSLLCQNVSACVGAGYNISDDYRVTVLG